MDANLYVVKSEPLIKVFEETLWGTAQDGKGIAHYIQDLLPYFQFSSWNFLVLHLRIFMIFVV